jgi:Flp pilus assembly protein TadG
MLKSTFSGVRVSRRGTVAAMVGLTLPVTVGVMALALDGGLLYLQRRQAQSAADSAALAAAYALSQGSSFSNARSTAIAVGSQNGITITSSQVTAPQAAVVAVSVTSSRPKMFSAIWGAGTASANASATAVAQTGINGFQANGSSNAGLLPIVLDKTTWQAMMAGQTTDEYTYNFASKTISPGPDGIAESQLYPVGSGSPGNWGTIKVGVSNNSTSTLDAQIRYGITSDQLAMYPNSTIKLDSTLSPPSITFQGNPGLSAGIKGSLTAVIGVPLVVPIYDQSGGNGNNTW